MSKLSRRSPACLPGSRRTRLCLHHLEERVTPTTFTVLNTNDAGAGSLRQAILDANAHVNSGGPDRIHFGIPGTGLHTIRPAARLPDVTDPVVIDGYTQAGASPNSLAVGNNATLTIEITGADAGEA